MKKQFKSRKKHKHNFLFWIILVILSFIVNNYLIGNVTEAYLLSGKSSGITKLNFDSEKFYYHWDLIIELRVRRRKK